MSGITKGAEMRQDFRETVKAAKTFYVLCFGVTVEVAVVTASLFTSTFDVLVQDETMLVICLGQALTALAMPVFAYGATLYWRRCKIAYFICLLILAILVSITSQQSLMFTDVYFHVWNVVIPFASAWGYRNFVGALFNSLTWGMSKKVLYATVAVPAVEEAVRELSCKYAHAIATEEDRVVEDDEAQRMGTAGTGFNSRVLTAEGYRSIEISTRLAALLKKRRLNEVESLDISPENQIINLAKKSKRSKIKQGRNVQLAQERESRKAPRGMIDMRDNLLLGLRAKEAEREAQVEAWVLHWQEKVAIAEENKAEEGKRKNFDIPANGPMTWATMRPNWDPK